MRFVFRSLLLGALLGFSASAEGAAPVSTASGTAAARGETSTAKPAAKSDAVKKEAAKEHEPKNSRPLAGFTPEREAAALAFVQANHPELVGLLERLKVRRPHDYEKAIRELYRANERLATSREASQPRYELELKQWQLTSRIQVLSARMSMKRTSEQERELKRLLGEQLAVHRELVAFNLERAKNRSAHLQRELDDIDARGEALVDAKFEKLLKAADQRKTAGKPAAASEKKADTKPSPKSDK